MSEDRSVEAVKLDVRGHRCPVPTLRLRRALEAIDAGASVILTADDPMVRIDVPLFVREAGHELVETTENAGAISFLVRKRVDPSEDGAPA